MPGHSLASANLLAAYFLAFYESFLVKETSRCRQVFSINHFYSQ